MDGAAVTITVMTLATCHTLGVVPTLGSALLLSIIATFGACGASGVAFFTIATDMFDKKKRGEKI